MGGAPIIFLPAHAQEAAQVAPEASPYDKALDRAFELGQEGKWDEARAELDNALKLAQTPEEKAHVYGQIGATYEAQGNHEQSQIQFRKVMEVTDVSVAQKKLAHLALATSLRDGKSFVEAGRETDLILADKAYNLDIIERMTALSIRGDAQMEAKEWQAARKTFDEILQLPVTEEEASTVTEYARAAAQFNNGKSYLRDGKPAEARAQLRTLQGSLAKLPQEEAMTSFFDWAAQQLIAQSYLDEKDNANARAELEKLLALAELPEDVRTRAQNDLAAVKTRLTDK